MGLITNYLPEIVVDAVNGAVSLMCFLAISCLYFSLFLRKDILMASSRRAFLFLLLCQMVVCFFDFLARVLTYNAYPFWYLLIMRFSFFAGGMMSFFTLFYLEKLVKERASTNKLLKNIAYCLTLLFSVPYLVPGLADKLVTVSNSGYAIHGPYMKYMDVLCLMLLIVMVVILLFHRNDMNKIEAITMFAFVIIPSIVNMQGFWYDMPTVAVCSIELMMLYIIIFQGRSLDFIRQQEQLAKQEALLADAKTKLVLSQIQPHFLYNALASISSLCAIDGKKAQLMTNEFARYLRGNLSVLGNDNLALFSQELNHVKAYLNIELIRFEGRLKVEYDIGVDNFLLPTLAVEPLVENAVKHGVCKKKEGGVVKLSTFEKEDCYLVVVEDDGVGFDTNVSLGVGIENVKARLQALVNGKLDINSVVNVGTVATITVPK